jgi:D-glycero-beta-D-manno-heptose-7-phosphate kinase
MSGRDLVRPLDLAHAVDLVRAFAGRRVVVIGDLMLDAYLVGETRRISPEAPVPVVEITERSERPGGAANTALNLAALGARPILLGVIGTDADGDRLRACLDKAGIESELVVRDATRPTTCKTRIVARGQQIVRLDSEVRVPVAAPVEEKLLDSLEEALAGAEACVLSDYGKGVLTERVSTGAIGLARRAQCPVVVDPKGKDFTRYRGCTVVTPNVHELEAATGDVVDTDDALLPAAARLLQILEGAAVLVTRGAAGMTLVRQGHAPRHVSTAAQRVYDVTGAGDTVTSTLALALATGLSLEVGMELANRAAGVVVGKMGAASVTWEELSGALSGSELQV